jgi:hypothetical protein
MSGISRLVSFVTKHKNSLAMIALVILGVAIWSQRISSSQGFMTDDCTHLDYSYHAGLRTFPYSYLPWVTAHRPIGRDAITVLLRLFGENAIPMIWTSLGIHILTAVIVWRILLRLTGNWPASISGAAFFLLNISAYFPIYWTAMIFDLLSTFFLALLLLLLALSFHAKPKYRSWLVMLTVPVFLAAVKTKESAMVAIVPLGLMAVLGYWERRKRENVTTTSARISQRLRGVSIWEVVWLLSIVSLVIVLALTVQSNYRGINDPAHPYYSEYSLGTIAKAFRYYLAVMFFRTNSVDFVRPPLALIALFVLFSLALILRNRWMILGWIWFVVLLLPLASLPNHFEAAYYPYPASIGAALYLGELFKEVHVRLSKWRLWRRVGWVLPFAFIGLMAWQTVFWLRHDNMPGWYDELHERRAAAVKSLKEVLPQPPPNSEVVLVFPEVIHLDLNTSSLVRVIYHDQTLTGHLFKDEREAEKSFEGNQSEPRFLAVWNGSKFELRR